MATTPVTPNDEAAKIAKGREQNAHPGFFLRSATWLLARFPLTRNRYQNWTPGRRILVGWILWIVLLPIIPIVAAIIWYLHDPEGFKKSPWAKALMALVVVWAGYFGMVATNPAQIDQNGKYSPIQTAPDGEKATLDQINAKPESAVTEEAKKKVANQTKSNPTNGKKFENCTAAFEAGVFDIKRSDSAYQNKLDRDNDGIACEK
ncbi:excalibur calcium-binding domain-containing protein [Candidatus Saccharibacteria bacterium]|jgi:hypothetical protein|nr:MAG: excalibur calcium-binding domain-containing protein [Candidatus Saccharibacteria bacterium]